MSPVIIGIRGSTLSHGLENPLALPVDLLLLPPFSRLYWPNPSPASTTLFRKKVCLLIAFCLLMDPSCSHDWEGERQSVSQTHEKTKLKIAITTSDKEKKVSSSVAIKKAGTSCKNSAWGGASYQYLKACTLYVTSKVEVEQSKSEQLDWMVKKETGRNTVKLLSLIIQFFTSPPVTFEDCPVRL